MQRIAAILILLFAGLTLQAQPVFKTVAPAQTVVENESFQLQYILEDAEKAGAVTPPDFKNFRIVTDPYTYTGTASSGSGIKSLRNTIYTLAALQPGVFIIPGAIVSVNGKNIRSNDVLIKVISKEAAARKAIKENGNSTGNPAYVLAPGEDPYEKIKRNLFLKVQVDKKNCYVGQPVVATFKLYSRLQSRSDIVKNPGFYGFTVYDMVNLADKQVSAENVNGQLFDVHTIRKVQLYPLQAGVFMIDPMELRNKVEFSRSMVNKKTEQEIVEGVLIKKDDDEPAEGVEVFETDISTGPVTITVKPAPTVTKPESFTGATGHFSIKADIEKNKLAKNEEGFLNITIQGDGNFIQLIPPAVQWPAGIEAFSPELQDSLQKSASPLSGKRVFRFGFLSAAAGRYTIPAVSISFFNPDSGVYRTIATTPVTVEVGNAEKIITPVTQTNNPQTGQPKKGTWLFIVAAAVGVIAAIIIGLYRRNRNEKNKEAIATPEKTYSVEEAFSGTAMLAMADDKSFYNSLHQSVWQFFAHYLHLSGSEMKKETLLHLLSRKGIDKADVQHTGELLEQSEKGMFTSAVLDQDKNQLLADAKELLQKIEKQLL